MRKNMETNKQWKRVPFTIGLAKDIQSGKVEGRIVTSEDLLVRIVDFNFKDKTDSIVYIGTYANGEQEFIQTCDNEGKSFGADVLFIELPEETPKYDDTEEVPTGDGSIVFLKHKKHEFKVGDVVKVTPQDSKHSEWIIGFGPVIARVLCQTSEGVLLENKCGFIDMFSLDEIQFITDASHDSNHEFKPFDKVLVRDNSEDKWVPDIFRYYNDNYPKNYPYRCCANDYMQCIPYEGNEHLLGTTNNPE